MQIFLNMLNTLLLRKAFKGLEFKKLLENLFKDIMMKF